MIFPNCCSLFHQSLISLFNLLSLFSFPRRLCRKWQIHLNSILFHLHPLGFWWIFYCVRNLRSDTFLLSNDLVSIWSLARILLPVESLCGMFLVSKMSGTFCSPPERAKLLMWSVSQRHTASPCQLIWAQFIWNTEKEEKGAERDWKILQYKRGNSMFRQEIIEKQIRAWWGGQKRTWTLGGACRYIKPLNLP